MYYFKTKLLSYLLSYYYETLLLLLLINRLTNFIFFKSKKRALIIVLKSHTLESINVYCCLGFLCLELKLGQKLNEGKTKQIFELVGEPGQVLVQSKDQITAGNAVRKDQMEGKAAIANKTTSCVFKLLQDAGEISFLLI